MKEDFRELMEEFFDYMDHREECCEECCDDCYDDGINDDGCEMRFDFVPGEMSNLEISRKREYNKREFIKSIFEIGEQMFNRNIYIDVDVLDSLFESTSDRLLESFDAPYFAVRRQKNQIAIAAPVYIPNAPVEIGKALGIIPDVFIEVSGPMATVLVIDCEKEWLRKQYLKIGEDEWLL